MEPLVWWKNFALGTELDLAGTFVYNGIKALHDLDYLDQSTEIFEVLYDLSIGIERLLKVAVVLLEHTEGSDLEALEQSLITHSTSDLAQRVNVQQDLGLADIHREWLALLSKFYKSFRYHRFSASTIPDIDEEKSAFLRFLSKHLKLRIDLDDPWSSQTNTDQIRRFVGKLVKTITDALFQTIRRRADQLNIYTTELRSDSKAVKVFWGKRLDFIEETFQKKELLLFLLSPKSNGSHMRLLRSVEALELDPEMVQSYIRALLNDVHLYEVAGYINESYSDVDDVKTRLDFLRIVGDEHVYIEEDPEA